MSADIPLPPLDTLHTPISTLEKTVLREFLREDESMTDTIDNLEQLLAHYNIGNTVSSVTLFNLRRALVSLESLKFTMEEAS